MIDFERDLERLAERGDRKLPREVVARALSSRPPRAPEARRRAPLSVAAALVAVLVGAMLWIGIDRDAEVEVSSTSPVPTPTVPANSETTAPASAAPELLVPTVDVIAWSNPVELGSVARSQVAGIVSGPGGFVATGMGFDDGRNQGRVWFTADGESWTEPAFDLFDAKIVGLPAATSSAFFVVAATNSDRTRANEGEAQAPVEDAQLYRSIDGQNWEPWGDPFGRFADIAATEDTLLRSNDGRLEWSADGLAWTRAAFEANSDATVFQLGGAPLVSGEPNYLHGFDRGMFTIWSSIDGKSWSKLPDPPVAGFVVAQPDGPVLFSNPTADACLDAVPQRDPSEDLADQQWSCGSPIEMRQLDSETSTWRRLEDPGPGPTMSYAPILHLGNTLVAAVTEPTRALTIWTSPAGRYEWRPDPTTTLNYGPDTGSPGAAVAAASATHIIIVSEDRAVADQTGAITGTLRAG